MVTLLAVTAGTLLAGVAGALIAVPACSVTYHTVIGYRGHEPDSLTTSLPATRKHPQTTVPSPANKPSEAAVGAADAR